jgi:hypothetical protein
MNGQAVSRSFGYTALGASWSTTGVDYRETVTVKLFKKSNAQAVEGWVVLQVPEGRFWVPGKRAAGGTALFTVDIYEATGRNPPESFSINAWIYSLDPSTIYANQFSNLRIVKETVSAIPSITSTSVQGGQLTIRGSITLGTGTMSLSNVQVTVQVLSPSGQPATSTSLSAGLMRAGAANQFTATLTAPPPGTYTVQVTITDLTTGRVIGTSTATIRT